METNTRVCDIYNYAAVDGKLATSGQPTEAQLASVAHEGYEVVINLALHDDPRYSLRDEPGVVRSLAMEYVHIPVAFDLPSEADLLAFFDAVERYEGRRLFVHCAANMRVSAFVGLYKAIKKQESPAQAFALMNTIWEPNAVWARFIASMLQKHGG